MGSSYTTLVGTPPLPTKLAFRTWFLTLLANRIANCPVLRATNYFFAQAGNDANDGRDPYGFNVSAGSWNPATLTLSKTGAFTSYTAGAGTIRYTGKADLVYIKGGTGVTTGLYEIASATANTLVLKSSISSGSPTDVTTSNGPKQTVATAAAGLVAANVGLFFNRGDTWSELPSSPGGYGLLQILNVNNVTMADYGSSLLPPWFRNFRFQYNPASWVNQGSGRWTQAETRAIGWVRFNTRPFDGVSIWQRVTSTALVQSTSLSWYWDGTTIHINPGTINPTSVVIESCPRDTTPALLVSNSDGTRIQGLRLDGWGCDWTQTSNFSMRVESTLGAQGAGILSETLVIDCEAFFGSVHLFGHQAQGVSNFGGAVTFVNCKGGAFAQSGGGGSNFVCGPSNAESIFYQCECLFGALPDSTWYPTTNTTLGGGFQQHVSGGGPNLSLAINWECESSATIYGVQFAAVMQNVPVTSGNLANCRGFVVGERVVGYQALTNFEICPTDVCKINGVYELRNVTAINPWTTATESGWLINSIIRWDAINQFSASAGYPSASFFFQNPPHNFNIWHSQVEFVNSATGTGILNPFFDPNTYAPNGVIANSTISVDLYATGVAGIGLNTVNALNNAANLLGNAYYGITTRTGTGQPSGYNNDANKVEPVVRPDAFSPPNFQNQLFRAGVPLPGGYVLEYDLFWTPRKLNLNPTIGAIADEPLAFPTTTAVSAAVSGTNVVVTITVTALVTPPVSVNLSIDGGPAIVVPLVNGVGTYTVVNPLTGTTHTATATYPATSTNQGDWTTSTGSATFTGTTTPPLVGITFDVSNDYLDWLDNIEPVTFTPSQANSGLSRPQAINIARRSQLTRRELATSQGAYVDLDAAWIIPAKQFLYVPTPINPNPAPRPGDIVTDGQGGNWTVLEAKAGRLGSSLSHWRLICRNPVIAYELQDLLDIQRPTITYDASGGPVRAWPDNNATGINPGGSIAYAGLAGKVQLLTQDLKDERGLHGFQGNYAVFLAQQVQVTQEDRIKWTDRTGPQPVTRYLDVKGVRNPLRIDELPVVDAWLAI